MEVLSARPDAFGFYYGFWRDSRGDSRSINVRHEGCAWRSYVDGEMIPSASTTIDDAEEAAIQWADQNPQEE